MKPEKEKADASTPAKTTNTKANYQRTTQTSTEKRIAERLESMPKAYRKTYRAAIKGKSRKAAMNAFCLECVGWERQEVKLCTAKACPLYPYRPYQDLVQNTSNECFSDLQEQNGDGLNNYTQTPVKKNQDEKTAIREC